MQSGCVVYIIIGVSFPTSDARRHHHDHGGRFTVGIGVALSVVGSVEIARVVVDIVSVIIIIDIRSN